MSDATIRSAAERPTASPAKILTVSGLGLLFDAMDVSLFGYVLVSLAKQWHLQAGLMGALASVGFIGMAVGSATAGLLADRYGRRRVFMWTVLTYSLATGLTALSTGVAMFAVLRFIVGFGLGGELPVATTYVLESSPDAQRGRRVVYLETFWACGSLVAAILSRLIIPSAGWRMVFLVGAIPALYTWILRISLPETPQFRLLTKRPAFWAAFRLLWKQDLLRATCVTWILWWVMNFCYYGMFLWLPSIMSLKGYSLVNSISYVLVMTIAQIPGYLTAAWLVERWGRKGTLVPAMLGSALSALGFGFAHSTGWLIVFGLLLNYFMLAAFAGTYIFSVEQFPTRARGSGIGWAAGFGRLGSTIAPFLVGSLIARGTGFGAIFTVFFGVLVLGCIITWLWGKETKGVQLS